MPILRAPIKERLAHYSTDLPNGCRQWTGYVGTSGYGEISVGGTKQSAYRVAYEVFVGPVTAGLELDHLCRNRLCVNPAHLEPVTKRENVLRGDGPCAQHARKAHCKNGHEFVSLEEKTPQGYRPRRRCLTCQLQAIERYRKSAKGIAMRARHRARKLVCVSHEAGA